MRRVLTLRALVLMGCALAVGACSKQDSAPAGETKPVEAKSGAESAAAASAETKPGAETTAAAKPAGAPVAGAFQGSYNAQAVPLAVPDHVKWRGEDEADGKGEGQLELTIEADGRVHGTGKGALGAMVLRGHAVGDELRVEAVAADPKVAGYFGTLVAKREGDGWTGTLRAAPNNGALIRESAVSLKKGG